MRVGISPKTVDAHRTELCSASSRASSAAGAWLIGTLSARCANQGEAEVGGLAAILSSFAATTSLSA